MGARALSIRAAASAAAAALALGVASAAYAQADPSGRWMTLETPHFRVHVRPPQERLGERVAVEAEAAWRALAAHLPAPHRRVDLVVDDHVDYANGFTTVFPSPRIVLYPVPPTADVELQRYDRWLRLLITHELAHVFHLDLARGWWRLGRSLFGRAPLLFPNLYLPTWMIEGVAVHYESELTAGGRDAGSYHAAVVAAQAAERGGLTIDAANATSPRWPGGYRPYAFGGEFLADVARRSGEGAIDRLAVATATRPVPYLLLDGAVRRATGVSATRAWAQWQRQLRERVPSTGADATVPAGAVRGLRALVAPRVSRDGSRVLFALADGRDAARIAVLDRRTGSVRPLARLNDGLGLAWDTGGGVVASEYDFTDAYTLRADLWRVDGEGRERRLTRGARLLAPDVGPDGSIVAVRLENGEAALVRWSRGAVRTVVPAAPPVEWAQPRISPDGSLIAATRAVAGALDVVLLDRDGRLVREVTSDGAIDQMAAFSADGAWLFWASDRGGRSEIYAARTADRAGTWWRVTTEPFGAYAPAPASDSVFYLAYHSDGYRLAAVPFDTLAWARVPPPVPSVPPAPAVPSDSVVVSRHGYRPWPAILPQYWLPVGATQGRSSWFGLYSSGADALGRHAWSFSGMLGFGLAAGTWRTDAAYRYAGLRRIVLDAAVSRAEEAYLTLPPGGGSAAAEGCCARTDEAVLGVTVPARRYRTGAAVRVAAEYQDAWGRRRAGAVVSAAVAHVVQPAFAISAQQGWRFSGFARRRWRLTARGGAGYTEGVLRGSAYLPLARTGFARQVLALRGAVGWLAGTDTVLFGVGGVAGAGVPLLPGFSVGASERDFPVRGFGPGDALGRGAASVAVEWRVPLALVGRGVGLVPGALDRVSLAAFGDAGVAWSPAAWTTTLPGLPARTVLGSAGAELVTDLGVVYDYPVRLRLGGAQRLRGPRRGPAGYLAVGFSF